jgi:hypothetical protein
MVGPMSDGVRALGKRREYSCRRERLVIVPGIETIDASAVDTSVLGHSYVGDSVAVLNDLAHLFSGHQQAIQRAGLEEIVVAQGRYWQLSP